MVFVLLNYYFSKIWQSFDQIHHLYSPWQSSRDLSGLLILHHGSVQNTKPMACLMINHENHGSQHWLKMKRGVWWTMVEKCEKWLIFKLFWISAPLSQTSVNSANWASWPQLHLWCRYPNREWKMLFIALRSHAQSQKNRLLNNSECEKSIQSFIPNAEE